MGRGLTVRKREYREVNMGGVGHRNRRDDDSNRIRKGKVPNRYNFAIYEMRLKCFRCFVIPIIRNMKFTFLLMSGCESDELWTYSNPFSLNIEMGS